MYCSTVVFPKAKKEHRCTYCGETILVGEEYARWNSVDDSWNTSKMHHECLEDLQTEYDGDDYIPYQNERPKRSA